MRNERLATIEKEIAEIKKRLRELEREAFAELTRELGNVQSSMFNGKSAVSVLEAIAEMTER